MSHRSEETVIYLSDNMRMYERSAPSEFRVRTFLGRILITSERFLFLSAGTNKLLESIATKAILGGTLGGLVLGTSLTRDLTLDALRNDGSLDIQLASLDRCEVSWKFPLVWYLAVASRTPDGTLERAFMQDGAGLKPPALEEIRAAVTRVRASRGRS